jgi:hypothetical protein
MAKVCQNKTTHNTLVPNGQELWPVRMKSLGIPLEWELQPWSSLLLSKCRCLIVPVVISLGTAWSMSLPFSKILYGCHPPWTKCTLQLASQSLPQFCSMYFFNLKSQYSKCVRHLGGYGLCSNFYLECTPSPAVPITSSWRQTFPSRSSSMPDFPSNN